MRDHISDINNDICDLFKIIYGYALLSPKNL